MLTRMKAMVFKHLIRRSAISMWKRRARQYGRRAVLNLGHSDEEMEAVTKMQKAIIFPFLEQQFLGNERTVLDLGCGPGRFSLDLADTIGGRTIAVDPVQQFLDMAPKSEKVEYRLMTGREIPVADRSVDVVWICLVLGGITRASDLQATLGEVRRVLKSNGLVCLTENTSDRRDGEYWKFRSVKEYQALFHFANLKHCSDYEDLGERISILAGRKIAES